MKHIKTLKERRVKKSINANESLLPTSRTHPKHVLPNPTFQLLLSVPV